MPNETIDSHLRYLLDNHFPSLRKFDIHHERDHQLSETIGKYNALVLSTPMSDLIYCGDGIYEAPPDAQRGILAHELAHIFQRRSRWWQLLDRTVYTVMRMISPLNEWYHQEAPLCERHQQADVLLQITGAITPRDVVRNAWRERNADLLAIQRGCRSYLDAYQKYFLEKERLSLTPPRS